MRKKARFALQAVLSILPEIFLSGRIPAGETVSLLF